MATENRQKKLTGPGYPHSSPPELCLYSFVSYCKVN